MESLWQFGLLGLVSGGAYALTGLGILAVYKGSRVINLAQGAMGMAGSYFFWELYQGGTRLPVWLAFVLAIVLSAGLGAVLYLGVMRLVRDSAETVRMITTLGILISLQSIAAVKYGSDIILTGPFFGEGSVEIFGATMTAGAMVVVAAVALMTIAVAVMFTRTPLGNNAIALQDNPSAASAVGISPHPTGAITWAFGSAAAAMAGIVLLPVTGLAPTQLNSVLVPALAAVLLARFRSVTITVVAGLAFGIFESIGVDKGLGASVTNTVPFVIIVLVLLFSGSSLPNRDDSKYRLPSIGSGRIQLIPTIIVVGIGVLLVAVAGPSWQQAVTTTALISMIALSVVVVTGYAGQLSLAPLALAGFSALITTHLAFDWGWPFLVAVLGGTLAAGIVGIVFGAPASRVRGANLAIVTLGLAMAIETAILREPKFTGGLYGLKIPNPTILGLDLSPSLHPDRYAYACLILATIAALLVVNIRSNASGRRYAAIRSSERGAAALGVSVAGTKTAAFATSGLLAGLAGALMAFRFTSVGFSSYALFNGLTIVGLVVVGGTAYISGGIFAAVLALGGISSLFFADTLGLSNYDPYLAIITGLMIIATMAFIPDGQMPLNIGSVKRLVAAARGRRVTTEIPQDDAALTLTDETDAVAAAPAKVFAATDRPASDFGILAVRGVTVRFGGVKALSDVTFDAEPGKVLGIVGPNGAGKTTLIDVISGFRAPSDGHVELAGRRLPPAKPREAAKRGIARTFQNLELFDDLTVRENLLVATEKFSTINYLTDSVLRRKSSIAPRTMRVLELFGLADSLDLAVENLPQGKRRLLAVARALAQDPSVICLDEPAAGVSPSERPELGAMIRSLAHELNMAVILVEHDVDLVSSVCDELVVLNFGQEIARGNPSEVLGSDAVRTAYLGSGAAADEKTEVLSGTATGVE
jgi:sulfate-transporting ATPase